MQHLYKYVCAISISRTSQRLNYLSVHIWNMVAGFHCTCNAHGESPDSVYAVIVIDVVRQSPAQGRREWRNTEREE